MTMASVFLSPNVCATASPLGRSPCVRRRSLRPCTVVLPLPAHCSWMRRQALPRRGRSSGCFPHAAASAQGHILTCAATVPSCGASRGARSAADHMVCTRSEPATSSLAKGQSFGAARQKRPSARSSPSFHRHPTCCNPRPTFRFVGWGAARTVLFCFFGREARPFHLLRKLAWQPSFPRSFAQHRAWQPSFPRSFAQHRAWQPSFPRSFAQHRAWQPSFPRSLRNTG